MIVHLPTTTFMEVLTFHIKDVNCFLSANVTTNIEGGGSIDIVTQLLFKEKIVALERLMVRK